MHPHKQRPTVFLLLLACCLPVWAVADCEVNGQAVNTANGFTTQGKTGIMRCKDRDSGQLVREQELRAGQFVGLVRYFKNGQIEREYSVNSQGNRDGRSREFGPNGQVLLDETYRNSDVRGITRSWHPDGSPRRVAFVGDDPRERASAQYTRSRQLAELVCGPKPLLAPHVDDVVLCGFQGKLSVVETFADNGTLRAANTWLAGVNQKSVTFHGNGKPASVDETLGEQRVQQSFSAEGAKLKEVVWSLKEKTAARVSEREFADSGTLVHEQVYALVEVAGQRQNRLVAETRFYLNGQPRSKDSFSLDGRQELREARQFHDNGQLAAQGRYVVEGRYRERPTGVHQRYSEQGRLVQENTYNDKGNIQRERAWDAAGQLLRDDVVFEDGSRKAFAK
jgi:antitoxin component YwqK of YwqJK toxin-antitoxin module